MSKITSYMFSTANLARSSSKENGLSRPGKTTEKIADFDETKKPRQTLGVIQTAATKGLARPSEKSGKTKKSAAQIRVFEDPKEVKILNQEAESQTELTGDQCHQCLAHSTPVKTRTAEEEAHRLMVQEEVPLEYWKSLAEERRQALEDSLLENEVLHAEVSQLKDDNEKLTELAGQAEYFAEMFKVVTEVDAAESEQSPESDDTTTEEESETTSSKTSESKEQPNGHLTDQ